MVPHTDCRVCLRKIVPLDLATFYQFNLDAEGNRLAATIPRNAAAFAAHWNGVFADSAIVARAICVDDELAGYISCFQRGAMQLVGYWVARDLWGKGVATCALKLLLDEVTTRPLHAQVAASNLASLRVLQKCGFVVVRVERAPADDRNLECDEALLVLP